MYMLTNSLTYTRGSFVLLCQAMPDLRTTNCHPEFILGSYKL